MLIARHTQKEEKKKPDYSPSRFAFGFVASVARVHKPDLPFVVVWRALMQPLVATAASAASSCSLSLHTNQRVQTLPPPDCARTLRCNDDDDDHDSRCVRVAACFSPPPLPPRFRLFDRMCTCILEEKKKTRPF